MKMILAVLPNSLSDKISRILVDSGFRVTKFADIAGILSGGTTTLMIGAENDQVEDCLTIIRDSVPAREEMENVHPRVNLFVLDVTEFSRV
jgi:uncharacterized protein YaaQ